MLSRRVVLVAGFAVAHRAARRCDSTGPGHRRVAPVPGQPATDRRRRRALRRRHCKLLWTYDAGDIIESSAAIADGVVYVGAGDGRSASRSTSRPGRCAGSTRPATSSASRRRPSPADVVYHRRSGWHGCTPSARPTASALWTFKTGGEIKSSPVVVNDLVLIGSYDTAPLRVSSAKTGALRWKFQTEGPVHATPAVLGDLAFIAGCDAKFRAIRIADGKQAYEISIGAYTGASPVVDGDRAYFGTFDNEVLALDLNGRKILWRFPIRSGSFPSTRRRAVSDGRICHWRPRQARPRHRCGDRQAAWTFATRARVDSSPVVAGDRVYVGSSDNRLYVARRATGQKQWEFDTGAAITASPAIAGGRVVIGSQNGTIYCFG